MHANVYTYGISGEMYLIGWGKYKEHIIQKNPLKFTHNLLI